VKKIIEYSKKNREIPWERVYGFGLRALVKFRQPLITRRMSPVLLVMET